MSETERILYLGIDPGQSGGIATADGTMAQCWKMPETERDTAQVIANLAPLIKLAWIESVHSMPKQGVSSSFKFGRNYGFLRGLLIAYAIPFEEITPQSWMKLMGCMSRGDKNITKAKAQQLFPEERITHATADALLIAECCRRVNERELQKLGF